MISNYQHVLDYLYQSLPMFQRVGATAYKKDLSNTIALCEAFGNPQHKFKSIHVAGTNGKGSTSHMLASVLQSAGYKTGLYTSPHLKEFTERIKVNGEEVSQQFVLDFVKKVKPQIELLKPSFFEITVVMAFEYFAQQEVDIAVIEVGLGGRLDSTNVITPEVSVITNIGYDHMDLLGDTLLKIGFEKAGVIKPGVPVVISERQREVEGLFMTTAKERGSAIYFASDEYVAHKDSANRLISITKNSSVVLADAKLPLSGNYQLKNIPGVLKTLEVLEARGYTTKDAIQHGLANVITQTGLKGRWQKLGSKPLMYCDTGHNVDGIRETIAQINSYTFEKLFIVLGMVKDKSRKEILTLFPQSAHYYFCQAKIPRALDANELEIEAKSFGLIGEVIGDVNDAIHRALETAGPNDFIFIGGSTFVVAEIENL